MRKREAKSFKKYWAAPDEEFAGAVQIGGMTYDDAEYFWREFV